MPRPHGTVHLNILHDWSKRVKSNSSNGWLILGKKESRGIQELFQVLVGRNQSAGESAKRLSSLLLESTLEYRDELFLEKGIVVTVEDVRKTLDWLLPALFTGNIPQLDNKIQEGLLQRWISRLRDMGKSTQEPRR